MPSEIERILRLLEQSFEANAWHGPSVTEALHQMTEEEAYRRLPNTHNIIELVGHMTTWRRFVVRKLLGDRLSTVSDESNFPAGTSWIDAFRQLELSQKELCETIRQFPAEKLFSQVPGKTQPLTYYTLLHGIIHHDLYHAGQIVLIRKATDPKTI